MLLDPHKLLWYLENPATAWPLMAFIGACFGSFISLLSYRLPRDLPVAAVHSRCPACQRTLGIQDLIPILSWAWQRGRCRACKTEISWRYPAIELLTAVGFLWVFHLTGVQWQLLTLLGLLVCLLTLIVADLEHYIIPDEIQIAMLALGMAHLFITHAPLPDHITGMLIGGGTGLALRYGFLYLRNKDGLGMGDVKFLAVSGLWLGPPPLLPYLFYAGILGVITAIIWRMLGRGERYPFGPSLAISLWLCVLFPALSDAFWQLPHRLS